MISSLLRTAADSVRDGLFRARIIHRTGVARALRPWRLGGFVRAARVSRLGPHLLVMLHGYNEPLKPAIVDGARTLRYGRFNADINRLAHALIGLGVAAGDRVGLMLPNCLEYVVAQQALARLGAGAVQIGYRLKPQEVAYILQNAEPSALFVHPSTAAVATEARRLAGCPDRAHVILCDGGAETPAGDADAGWRWDELLAGRPGDRPPRGANPDLGGLIVYTSGTTGKPKGAARNWKQTGLDAIGDFVSQIGMRTDDRHLVVCPLYHSGAAAFVGMVLAIGGTLVMLPHFDAAEALAVIERERVTSAFMVPTMLVRLCALPEAEVRRHDLASLRWVVSGAAPLATETARRFQERFGPILWNFYGATETGTVTLAGPADHTARPGTVGRLLRGNEIRLLDDAGNEVPRGEIGELYVRNEMLIAGYHRDSAATNRSIKDGFFSVGDLARMDEDGYLYLESRKRDMVISGGVNIYPREIEDHLHTHPDIIEAAVIGVPDPEWGEALKAFVVRRPDSSLTEEEIVSFCRESLAAYKQPRQIEFVEELPRNPTGKVLKRELRQRPQ